MTKPKPRPRSTALFRDIGDTLDTIVAHDRWPALVRLDSNKAAIKWAHRAHTFRSILREQEEHRLGLLPGTGTSIYDNLLLAVRDNEVHISQRSNLVHLIIEGEEVPVSPAVSIEEYEKDDSAID